MTYTIDRLGVVQTLPYGPFVDAEGVSHPFNVLDLWSDEELSTIGVTRGAPEVLRRLLPKSLVQERVNNIGKLDDVLALLMAPGNAIFYARWFAPDWPNVYYDDAGLLSILGAVGCTPTQITAILS